MNLLNFGFQYPHNVFLSLGTNLGNKEKNLNSAAWYINQRIGSIKSQSSMIETIPWGYESPNSFLNSVIRVETLLSPLEILHQTQIIEKEMGRTEKTDKTYQDRIIDIDLILYDDLIIESKELQLPHPLFHVRDFVLIPLCEIAPDIYHPLLKKTIRELTNAIIDKKRVNTT